MQITLAAIGRLKAGPNRELFDRYWDRLEGALLGGTGKRPIALVDQAPHVILEYAAEQIFETVFTDKRIAFKIQKQVAT